MLVEIKVPVLAESIPDATLLDWRKQVGESVDRDEILIELETDKVVLEVPASAAGVLTEIVKQSGETALSEEVLARIDTEAVGAPKSPPASTPSTESPAAPAAARAASGAPSPAARKIAEERGLDTASLSGSGRDGRVTKGDVLASAGAPTPAAAPAQAPPPTPAPATASATASSGRSERRESMTRLRSRVAERLKQAQNTAAILTTFNEINMGPVMALRKRYRDEFEKVHGVRLGFMSFFAKAAVQALQRFPSVNAYIEGTDIVYHDYCDIGIAVGSPRGLVVPILRNVEAMSFAGVEGAIAGFGAKAKDGSLSIEDMTGGTFTISNGGVFGSLLSTPILNPPQTAILGMHKTEERPVVENGEIVIRPMMYLALSYDHRIIDGREAVLFLVTIKEAIEDPARLLLEV